jgi:AcrR family transcriptional regulator
MARFSVRGVARRIGITHTAVAYHYRDRRALLSALAAQGYSELGEALDSEARQCTVGGGERVFRYGVAYMRFAEQNSTLFELMFSLDMIEQSDAELSSQRIRVWQRMLEAVTAATAAGWAGPGNPALMALAAWASGHGIAVLRAGALRHIPGLPSAEAILRRLADAVDHASSATSAAAVSKTGGAGTDKH